MYKGARVPVARSLAISSIVSRSQSCSPFLSAKAATHRAYSRHPPVSCWHLSNMGG